MALTIPPFIDGSSFRAAVAGACGRARRAERFVTVQSNVQLALECGHLGDLEPDGRARREFDWPRKVTEWSLAIGRAQARNVQNWLALKFASAALIKERVFERYPLRRCAEGLECVTKYSFIKSGPAGE